VSGASKHRDGDKFQLQQVELSASASRGYIYMGVYVWGYIYVLWASVSGLPFLVVGRVLLIAPRRETWQIS